MQYYATMALVLISVLISAIAQLTLKLGMTRPSMVEAFADGGVARVATACLTSPQVVGGLALYGLGAVCWLFVLAKLDLSVAYPFVGLGFVFTMLFAAVFLGENISLLRVFGTLLIIGGCIVVARTA